MDLGRLLSLPGSYDAIAAAVASRRIPRFPVVLFDHVGDIYRRVECAAGDDDAEVVALRLAALVHEETPQSLAGILRSVGLQDFAPTVLAVVNGRRPATESTLLPRADRSLSICGAADRLGSNRATPTRKERPCRR